MDRTHYGQAYERFDFKMRRSDCSHLRHRAPPINRAVRISPDNPSVELREYHSTERQSLTSACAKLSWRAASEIAPHSRHRAPDTNQLLYRRSDPSPLVIKLTLSCAPRNVPERRRTRT